MSCTVPCGVSFSSGRRLAADKEASPGTSFANLDSAQAKDTSSVNMYVIRLVKLLEYTVL